MDQLQFCCRNVPLFNALADTSTSAPPSNPVVVHVKGGVPPVQKNVTSSPTQKLVFEARLRVTTLE